MKKKIIALTLIFAMLVPFVPAAAAEETAARPTVEEILSQYHQAAFEAEMNGEESAAYSPRSGSNGPTLEQQTVDTLNEAGYEAYNVTADNYDTLEEQLQTDFADMGLDPEGSYIIVIHGEEEQSPNGNARLGDLILPPHEWEPGDGAGGDFTHTYNGTTYIMRYITVTAVDNANDINYNKAAQIDLLQTYGDTFFTNVADTAISMVLDEIFEDLYIGTFLSIMGLSTGADYTVHTGTLTFHAGASWNRRFIQVRLNSSDSWRNGSCVECVDAVACCMGLVMDRTSGHLMPNTSEPCIKTFYSNDYYDTTKQKNNAAIGYQTNVPQVDMVGDIDFYFGYNKVITLRDTIIC